MNKIYGKELVRMTQTKTNLLCQKIDESNVRENKRTYWKSDKGEKMNNVKINTQ